MVKKILLVLVGLVVLWAAGMGIFIGTATNVRQLRQASTLAPNGKAEKTRTKDALDYSVATSIAAPPEVVWGVLTDAPSYTAWNSTLTRFEGPVARDGTVKLVTKDAPDRTFELKVSTFDAPKTMVWEDGGKPFMGVRTFTLTPSADGTTFAMQETLSGAFLGMIEPKLPDFTKSFEAFAADLKKTAEAKAATAAR